MCGQFIPERAQVRGAIKDTSKIFFLSLNENVCCDPSLEPSRRDGSIDGYNIRFKREIGTIIPNFPLYPS